MMKNKGNQNILYVSYNTVCQISPFVKEMHFFSCLDYQLTLNGKNNLAYFTDIM